VGTNGCPQQALAARRRQSRQAMPAAPGMPGAARQILATALKAQVTPAPASCPRPGGPGAGNQAIIGCQAVYRIPPGPGRGHRPGHRARTSGGCGTAPGPAAAHLARVPGQRLTPAPETAYGKPADRAGSTRRSLAPPPRSRRPGAHSCR
jgi:hypothetical protein